MLSLTALYCTATGPDALMPPACCSQDGWITTAGFVVAANKGGLHLNRAQLLALERAVPKDTLGRINCECSSWVCCV